MPPASLSTLAVMMPGPITAATARTRAQRERTALTPPAGVAGSAMQDLLQDIVDGDDPEQLAVALHRQGEQVVLGGELRHPGGRILGREGRRVLVHDLVDGNLRRGEEQVAQRQDADELLVALHDEAVVDLGDLLRL